MRRGINKANSGLTDLPNYNIFIPMKTYTAMISWTIHGKKSIGHAKTIRGIKCETIQEAIEIALQSGPKNHKVCLNCIWPDYLKK